MKFMYSLSMAIALMVSIPAFSQDFSVPAGYELNSKEDYARYEKDIINAAKWLEGTPWNEQQDKREEVSVFVLKWAGGSPSVNIEIHPILMDFEKKNQGMLILYMAACARFVLENNYSTDIHAQQKAALKTMMTVYKSGKGIQKDKKMEKLIKTDEDGKLDEWLADNFKVQGR